MPVMSKKCCNRIRRVRSARPRSAVRSSATRGWRSRSRRCAMRWSNWRRGMPPDKPATATPGDTPGTGMIVRTVSPKSGWSLEGTSSGEPAFALAWHWRLGGNPAQTARHGGAAPSLRLDGCHPNAGSSIAVMIRSGEVPAATALGCRVCGFCGREGTALRAPAGW